MRREENDCVGCPQGCISCGRKHSLHIYCDRCGVDIGDPDRLYEENGEDLCDECWEEEQEEDENDENE